MRGSARPVTGFTGSIAPGNSGVPGLNAAPKADIGRDKGVAATTCCAITGTPV